MHRVYLFSLILILVLPLVFPYFLSGFPITEDGGWAIVRQAEMHRELRDGQFPPRWSGYLNHGFGYPLFLFTYPFPYYVGEVFHLVGIGLVDSVKILFVIGTLLSAVTMYLFTQKLWGNWGAIVATTLYLYAPYRVTNLYRRGSVGEVWAWVFYPLLFYLYARLAEKPTRKLFILTGISGSLLFFTHNASVVLFLPFWGAWVIYLVWKKKGNSPYSLPIVVGSFTLSLLLSTTFWLPAIVEKKFIALSLNSLADRSLHFLDLSQLLNKIHPTTQLPLHIGYLHMGVLVVVVIYLFLQKPTKEKSLLITLLLLSLCALFMIFPVSNIFWQLPLLREIDFPWRMLGIVLFLLSVLGGFMGKGSLGKYIVPVLAVVLVATTTVEIQKVSQRSEPDEYYETNDATTTSADELMPIWVTTKPTHRPATLIQSENTQEYVTKETSTNIEFKIDTPVPKEITVNKIYFPGWKIFGEGTEIPSKITSNTGLISFISLPGKNTYSIRFSQTPVRQVADSLSIITLLLLVPIWLWSKKFSLS